MELLCVPPPPGYMYVLRMLWGFYLSLGYLQKWQPELLHKIICQFRYDRHILKSQFNESSYTVMYFMDCMVYFSSHAASKAVPDHIKLPGSRDLSYYFTLRLHLACSTGTVTNVLLEYSP